MLKRFFMKGVLAVIAGMILTGGMASDAFGQSLRLAAGSGSGNTGDVVRIPVSLTANNTYPASAVITLTYDTAVLSLTEEDVVLGPSVTDEQLMTSVLVTPGRVRVVVYGFGDYMKDGDMFYLDFHVLAAETIGTAIQFVTPSFASLQVQAIPVTALDGWVSTNCGQTPTPSNVSAQVEKTGVRVSWTSAGEGVSYRVYRAATGAEFTSSVPISDWISDAFTFLDTDNQVLPIVGCFGGSDSSAYDYWVVVRNGAGCMSEPSVPAGVTEADKAQYFSAGAGIGSSTADVLILCTTVLCLVLARRRKPQPCRVK